MWYYRRIRNVKIFLFLFFQVYDVVITYTMGDCLREGNPFMRYLWSNYGFGALVLPKFIASMLYVWSILPTENEPSWLRSWKDSSLIMLILLMFLVCITNTLVLRR